MLLSYTMLSCSIKVGAREFSKSRDSFLASLKVLSNNHLSLVTNSWITSHPEHSLAWSSVIQAVASSYVSQMCNIWWLEGHIHVRSWVSEEHDSSWVTLDQIDNHFLFRRPLEKGFYRCWNQRLEFFDMHLKQCVLTWCALTWRMRVTHRTMCKL